MSEATDTRGVLFWIGWWTLVALTALFTANHAVGVWAFSSSDDEQMMFVAFTALQALGLVVLLIPYRRVEWWAWWATWIIVVAVAATVVVFRSPLGVVYLCVAVALALAQFAALPAFRRAAAR